MNVTLRIELGDGDYIDDDGNVRNDVGQVVFRFSGRRDEADGQERADESGR